MEGASQDDQEGLEKDVNQIPKQVLMKCRIQLSPPGCAGPRIKPRIGLVKRKLWFYAQIILKHAE